MDRYEIAIKHLTEHPEDMEQSYLFPGDYPIGGSLFVNCSKILYSFRMVDTVNKLWLGNIIKVKRDPKFVAETPSLTQAIRNDPLIPPTWQECTRINLEAIAAWHRKFDRELGRHWNDHPDVLRAIQNIPQPKPEELAEKALSEIRSRIEQLKQ